MEIKNPGSPGLYVINFFSEGSYCFAALARRRKPVWVSFLQE